MHDTLDVHVLITNLPSRTARSQRLGRGQRSYRACAVGFSLCIVNASNTLAFLLLDFLRTLLLPDQGFLFYLQDDNFAIFAGRMPLCVDA